MGIFGNLARVKAQGGVREIIIMLTKLDPKGMGEAEILTIEQKLDQVGAEVVAARNVYNREHAEHVAIVALRDTRLRAAENLQTQVLGLPEGVERTSKEASLSTLLGILEKMQPDVEREAREASEAKEDLTDIESAHNQAMNPL